MTDLLSLAAGFTYLERSLAQAEMVLLTRRLSRRQSTGDFAAILQRMAVLQERLLVLSQRAIWPTHIDIYAMMLSQARGQTA